MKQTIIRLPLAIPVLVLCAMLPGCDTANDMAEPDPGQIKAIASSQIESITSSPVLGPSGDGGYLLSIRLRLSPDQVVLPEAINILSQGEGLPDVAIYDSGKGVDEMANDGVYTGIVPKACLALSDESTAMAEKSSLSKCKIEFVGPGEKCGKFGRCPKKAHRSFLWGLIEYDTEVVLCFCLVDCEISSEGS